MITMGLKTKSAQHSGGAVLSPETINIALLDHQYGVA